jgi:predicted AAA+ superfamily ATPase
VIERLEQFPAVVILGPKQYGKTSLAGAIVGARKDAVYLDDELRTEKYARRWFQWVRDSLRVEGLPFPSSIMPKGTFAANIQKKS